MIIVSQDKDSIINFNNIEAIGVAGNRKSIIYTSIGCSSKLIKNTDEIAGLILGTYPTEERAKEILEEIAYLYVINQSGSTTDSEYRKSICYKMPEK